MKGFHVYINDRKIGVAVARGTVIVSLDNFTNNISISGIDTESFQRVQWFTQSDLAIGDKIKIVASDVEESCVPNKVEQIDRQKLHAEYIELKKVLTEEGLLK